MIHRKTLLAALWSFFGRDQGSGGVAYLWRLSPDISLIDGRIPGVIAETVHRRGETIYSAPLHFNRDKDFPVKRSCLPNILKNSLKVYRQCVYWPIKKYKDWSFCWSFWLKYFFLVLFVKFLKSNHKKPWLTNEDLPLFIIVVSQIGFLTTSYWHTCNTCNPWG